jgi:catechol 2,3-dioxygenase-like lactoylglutathione lyase family enzyme
VLRRSDVNAYLYLGTDLLELVQAVDPGSEPVRTGRYPHRLNGPANVHLGFRVEDLDRELERLTGLGAELISSPIPWDQPIEFAEQAADEKLRRAARPSAERPWRIAVIRDPDGAMIELVER